MTHQMATQILTEEIEHENDIEDWITDINRMKEEIKKFRV
jgi:bacterioferritin